MSLSRDSSAGDGFTSYRELFEAAVQPFILVDPYADRVVEANPAACKLLGCDRGLLLQLSFSKLHAGQLGASCLGC
jgi:PAS domain-containing protein